MNRPDHDTARARIRQLNAIPDRDRTDAEWEELNELEIMLAPGNREGAPDPSRLHGQQNRGRGPGPGGNPGGGNPGGGQHRRNKKNFQHRRPKGPPQGSPGPQGGGNGSGGGSGGA